MAAPGHRDHLPLEMELDIALPTHQMPVAPGPQWDREKLAGLVLRGRGRARFLEGCSKRVGGSCVGFKFVATTQLTAEEHWSQLSGAVCRAGQSFLQETRKRLERPEDTAAALQSMLQAREAVVHSPVDPVSLRSIHPAGFSAQHLPALCVFWRDLSVFWTARNKLDVLASHDETENDPGRPFQTAWDKRNFSEMWLAYRLSGRPDGLQVWVINSGQRFSPFLGTKEAVVLK